MRDSRSVMERKMSLCRSAYHKIVLTKGCDASETTLYYEPVDPRSVIILKLTRQQQLKNCGNDDEQGIHQWVS